MEGKTDTAFAEVGAPAVAILRRGHPIDIVARGGRAEALAWPGTGSRFRAMHRIELTPRGETVVLRHEQEAVYFVAAGNGRVGGLALRPRTMVYVPRSTGYRFAADDALTIYGGPCPPDMSLYAERAAPGEDAGDNAGHATVRLFDADREGVPLPVIGKDVRLVVWPGVGADVATMNFAILAPGEENQPHAHADSDDTIAILDGRGSIDDLTNGETHEFSAGDVVFVRAGIRHKVKADKGVRIASAGGPCPPDYAMLRALGLA